MGQLALSLAGAGIGFAFGGPTGAQIGWMLGGFAWNLLDPPKIQGPRLQDTKVRGADYGAMRPILYGMARIGGLGMGQGSTSKGPNEFTEHEEKSGGKGGPEQISYRYTLSFFNEICEGPIAGVQRRWANGRLITEAGAESNDAWPYTLYPGDAAQMPDPTMETIYGAGEVNPMRGVAYEAIEEKDVTDFGNARPNVEYEAFTKGGDIPWRVSTFSGWASHGTTASRAATYANGVITTSQVSTSGANEFYQQQFNVDGTQVGTEITSSTGSFGLFGGAGKIRNLNTVGLNGGSNPLTWYNPDPDNPGALIAGLDISATGGTGGQGALGNANVYMNDFIYTVGGASGGVQTIVRYQADNKLGGAFVDSVALDANYSASSVYLGTSDTGDLYVMTDTGGGAVKVWKFDKELAPLHAWTTTDTGTTLLQSRGNFLVYKGLLAYQMIEAGVKKIALLKIAADYSLTDYGVRITSDWTNEVFCTRLKGGLCIDQVGVFSLDPPPGSVILGDIVLDLCVRGGLDPSQVDVSDLTQTVRGFVVASQMTVRNAIDVLRKAFFFDAAEFDGKIVFRNRGHDATDTIPDGDLAAHEPGSEAPEPLDVTRVPESELPRTVFVNFYNVDNDYQQGSQYWRRTVTRSQSDVTLDLQVVMTATEAMQCAQWHMHFAWMERDRFTFYTTRKWSKLTPTDVVVVRGVNIRITNKVEEPNGRIKFDGVRAFAGGFTSGAPVTEPIDGGTPGSGGGGQPPTTPPGDTVSTRVVLLDIPIVSQGDFPFGFYAAMAPATAGRWTGAGLYKSIDGGTTWTLVASTGAAAVIGRVTADSLASYGGGDTVDESTCTVVLSTPDATLESITGTALTNGGNLCAIRSGSTWEICNFRDAVLTAPSTYDLTGFKRGRKGTTTAGHADGDTFVMLPTLNVDAPQTELNVALKYKAVSFGTAIADAIAVDFTNTGEAAGGSNGEVGSGVYDEIAAQFPIKRRDITAGTYTIVPEDRAYLLSFSNASGVTVTLPDDLPKHWWCFTQNIGVGDVDLDPSAGAAEIDGNGGTVVTLATDQGLLLQFDGTNYGTSRGMGSAGGGGGGSALTVKDEGSNLDTAVTSFDFVGGGVTATNTGHAVTVTVPLKAPLNASYVTLGTNSDITDERVLTGSSRVTVTDAGAGSTVTLDLGTSGVTAATYGDTDNISQVTVDKYGRVTAAANVAIVGRIHTLQDGADVDLDAIALNITAPLTAIDAGSGVTEIGFDGSAAAVGKSRSQAFTASGTFTVPASVSAVKLTMIGGGGAGANHTGAIGGGGGGAGELVENLVVPVTPGGSVTVTIGAKGTGPSAGTATTAGGNGTDTSFGSTYIAKGGLGAPTSGGGGAGGGGRGGAGGSQATTGAAGTAGTGITPTCFGGGGGGGASTSTTGAGGAGAPSAGNAGPAGGTTASTQGGGGSGASTRWGPGGAAGNGGAAGSNASSTSYGAGGGGAGGKTGSSEKGGDGCAGYCLVSWDE